MMNSTSTVGRMARLFQFNLLAFMLAVAAGFGSPNLSAQGCVNATSMTFGMTNTIVIDIEGNVDPCPPGGMVPASSYSSFSATGNVTIGNAMLDVDFNGYTALDGDVFTIVRTSGGSISGMFAQGTSVVASDGVALRINYSPTAVTLSRAPIFLTDEMVGVCEGDDAIIVSLSNFPLRSVPVNYNVGLVIEPGTGAPAGTASFATVTVPAGETTVIASFNEPGVGTIATYEGGTIMINNVSPSGGGANLLIDPSDVATIDVVENPVGTFAITTPVSTMTPTSSPMQICPGEDVEVTFTATAGVGPFDLTFEITEAGGTPFTFSPPAPLNSGDSFTLTEGVDFNGDINTIELTNIEDSNAGFVTCSTAAGNTETGMPLVDATDDVAPAVVTCPADFTVCEGDMVNFAMPTFLDNCDASPTIAQTTGLASGSTAPMNASGDTETFTYTFTATDASTNVGTCTFAVTVEDTPDFTITSDANVLNAASDCTGTGSTAAQFQTCSSDMFSIQINTDDDPAGTEYTLNFMSVNLFDGTALPVVASGMLVDGTQQTRPATGGVLEFSGMITNFQAADANTARVTFSITGTNTVDATCTKTETLCVAVRPEFRVTALDPAFPAGVCDGTTISGTTVTRNSTNGSQAVNYDFVSNMENGSDITISNASGQTAFVNGTITLPDFTFTNTGNAPGTATLTVSTVLAASNGLQECTGPEETFTLTVNPTPAISLIVNSSNGTTATEVTASSGATQIPTITVCDAIDNVNATFVINSMTANGLNTTADSTVFEIDITDNNPGNLASPMDATDLDSAGVAAYFTGADFTLIASATQNGSATVTITPYFDTNNDGMIDAGDCPGDPAIFNVAIEATPDATVVMAQDEVICSGATATIDVTLVPANATTAYSYVTDGVEGAPTTLNGGNMSGTPITEVLTNSTNAAVDVTFSVTPYSFGPDGVDNNGSGDDCEGTAVPETVTVEPVPTLSPMVDLTNTTCDDLLFLDTLITPTVPSTGRFTVFEVTSITPGAGVTVTSGLTVGSFIEGNMPFSVEFDNTTTVDQEVTVVFTAFIADDATGTGAECANTTTFEFVYTVEPTPAGMLVDEGTDGDDVETICSGDSPATTFMTTSPSAGGADTFRVDVIALNGVTRTGPATEYLRGSGTAVDTSSLMNATMGAIDVVYTVTPITAGTDGIFGTDDDCDNGVSSILTVTVEPAIVSPPADSIVRCFNVGPLSTYTLPAIAGMNSNNDPVEYLLVDTVSTRGEIVVSGTQILVGTDRFAADGNAVLGYDLVNNRTNDTIIVVFRFVPDFGNGICTGDTFDLTLFQEPRPTLAVNDVDQNGDDFSEEVCPGTVPVTTVSVVSPVGGNYLIRRINVNNNGGANVTGQSANPGNSAPFIIRADGDVIEPNTLENDGTVTGQVTYIIQPYSFGPDGVDDQGTNDDCLGRRTNYRINVPAEPVLATGLDEIVCSGEETGVILDETRIDNETTVSTTEDLVISTMPAPFTIQLTEEAEVGGTGTISGVLNGDFAAANEFLDLFADGILLGRIQGGECVDIPYSFAINSTDLATITADGEVEFTYGLGLDVDPSLTGCRDEISVDFTYDIEATFDVVAVLPAGLTTGPDFPTNAVDTSGDAISMDTFRNLTMNDIDVVYMVTPRNGNCTGMEEDVTVTVQPEPAGMNGMATVCSGDALAFDLATLVGNLGGDLNGVSFAYRVSRISGTVNEVSVGDTGSASTTLNEASLTNPSPSSAAVITYIVTPTGGNGCVGDPFVFRVTVSPLPFVAIVNGGDPNICEGSTKRLTSSVFGGTPPFTYTYSVSMADATDGVTVTPAPDASAGDIFVPVGFPRATVVVTLTLTGANGCMVSASTVLNVNETPEFAMGDPMDLDACEGSAGSGTAVFNLNDAITAPTAPVTARFYTSASDANAGVGALTNPAAYTATDDEEIFVRLSSGNCFVTGSFTLNVFPLPMVVLDPIDDVCDDDAVVTFTTNQTGGMTAFTIAPAAAQSAITDNGDGTASFDPAGIAAGAYTITFTYTDGNACANSASQIFNVLEAPMAAIATDDADNTICAGEMVTLTATGMGTFAWSTGETTPSITVAPVITTTYTVTVTSSNGCDDEAMQEIVVNPVPVVSIDTPLDGTSFCNTDGPVTLSGSTSAGTGVFTIGNDPTPVTEFDPMTSGLGTFVINFTVTDNNNCVTVETATVTVDDAPEAGEPSADFESTDDDVDYCLSTSPIDLATLLVGADQGGTFTIEDDPSGQARIVNGTLDVSDVRTTDATIEIQVRYTVDAVGNCPGDFAIIYINFEAVPFAGTQPGLAYLCEDYGEFGLDQLLVDATPGGTWTVISNNVGITLIGDDMDSIDTRDIVFLFQGQTVPESRTVQFRYTVEPSGNTTCDGDFVDAFLQINFAPTITRADADVVNDQVCFDESGILLTGTVGGSASTGSWVIVDGDGLLTNQTPMMVNGEQLFTAIYTPNVSDRGDSVRIEFVTNDPDGPLQTNALGFPFQANPCVPERDTVAILIFGEPVVTSTPSDTTICNETAPTNVLTTATMPQDVFFAVSAVSSDPGLTGFTANQPRLMDGDLLEPGVLVNSTTSAQTVTYTITPFDDGPDETANTGDECVGTDLTVVITVEPTPTIAGTATIEGVEQDLLDMQNPTATYEACHLDEFFITLSDFGFMSSNGTQAAILIDIVDTNPGLALGNGTLAGVTPFPGGLPTSFLPFISPLGESFAPFTLVNRTGVTQTVSITVTPYIDGNNDLSDVEADDCMGAPITFTFIVSPEADVEGTVNGTMVDATAGNNNQVFVVCDEDDNVDFTISSTDADPDSTLLMIDIVTSNLEINPSIAPVLTATQANIDFATSNDWRLTDPATNGQAVVTITPVFDRNGNGLIDADECEDESFTFTIDVNPTPVADPIADMTFCAGQMVPAMPLGSNITSTTGTVTFDYAVSNFNVGLNSGSGVTAIPAFTATNSSVTPITGLVTVTPIFTEDGVSCTGDPIAYTITVNPVAVVDGTVNGESFSAAANNTLIQVCDGDDNVDFGPLNTTTDDANTILIIETTSMNVAGGVGNTQVAADMAEALLDAANDYTLVDATTNGTVQIRITPFFDADGDGDITDGECGGLTAIIDIDVISTPQIDDIVDSSCSDLPIGTLLPTTDANGLALTSVTITAMVDPALVGTATTGTFTSASIEDAIAADQFTNNTGDGLDVVYTVTPNTADCPGADFTVTVTITSEPILSTMLDTTVCSDAGLGQTLEVAPGSSPAGLFRIISIVLDAGLTADVDNAMVGDVILAEGLEDNSFNNVTTGPLTATYMITPIGTCEGDAVMVVFTINPEPILTTADATVCSDEAAGLVLSVDGTAAAVDSFTISVDVPMGLIPRMTNFDDAGTTDVNALALDTFNNISGTDLQVTYTITPVSADGCDGDPVDVILTVESEPFAPDAEIFACSGEDFEFDIQEYIDDDGNGIGSSFTFTFENVGNSNPLINNANGNVNGVETYQEGQTYTDDVINTTFFNVFTVNRQALFTITPTATPGQTCGGSSFTVLVTVTPRVEAASINVGNTNDLCSGESKVLTGSGSNGTPPYTYNWSVASMDAGITSASVIPRAANGGMIADFTAEGSGQVVVEYFIIDANGCESDPQQATIDILPAPTMVTIMGETSICTGSVQMYSVTDVPGETYVWSINQGGTIINGAGTNQVTIDFSNAIAGVVSTISVTTGSGQCTATSTLNVTTEEVMADFTFVTDENMVQFTNTSVASGTPTFEYSFGDVDNSTSTDENPSFTYSENGSYQVCLTVTSGGCVDQVCQTVFVNTCDEIELETGLNYISLDVAPVDNSVTTVFSTQIGEGSLGFVQGRNASGNVVTYSPRLPFFLNTLQSIDPTQGYIVFMNGPSTLEVCGAPIDSTFRPALRAGINLVPFVPQMDQTVEEYFGDLYPGNLIQIRTYENGQFQTFAPRLPAFLNSLSVVKNGFGYEVALETAVGQGDWFATNGAVASREALNATNSYIVLAASTDLDDSYVGGEALVTDADGNVFAFMEIVEGGYLMTTPVYENELNAALEIGTELYVEVDDVRVPLNETFTGNSRLIYTDVSFRLTGIEVTEEGHAIEMTMSPNPFREAAQINLTLEESATVTITVTDFAGRQVAELAKEQLMLSGDNTVRLDGSALPSGTYLIHVIVDGVPLFHEQLIRIN